ncbi:hypothetical protein FUA23_16250 [Neolewinella aurantiaca]|uniref:Uncharacterized protein n=1 Tax=Neolewinella aurantiaca TaxID=2602767 RepID=A0A5C7FTC1_9BACT|nr:hypothetical protein [Neolewinella aurantiaca]TXF88033.1 hypothetical protein FUA23_16250 [Neolewinella aurantiaca]
MPSNLLDDHRIPTDLAVYQRFNRSEDLRAVVTVLRENDILVKTSGEDVGEWREATIIGAPLQPKFWIEIPAVQFEKANYVLQEEAEKNLAEEDLAAHPFADYSIEELEEVLLEETEWDAEAVVVARRLLLRQGRDVDLKALRQKSRERLAREYIPRSGTRWVMAFFTLYGGFAGLAVWIVSLLISLGILLYYVAGSRRDPNGVKHWAYDVATRQLGRVAVGIVFACLVFGLVNFFYLGWVRFPPIDVWYWLWF